MSKGNPLTAFWLVYNCILGDFVQIKDYKLIPTKKFNTNVNLDTWTNLKLPFYIFKKNQVSLQRALVSRTNGRPVLDTSIVV
jgi:hypothetical protein